MSSYTSIHSQNFGSDNWCLGLQPLYNHALLTSLSNGEVHHLDWVTGKSKAVEQAGTSSINKLKIINADYQGGSQYAVASNDSVNVFDIRSRDRLASLKNDKNAPFLSLDSRHGLLACGTELTGADAEVHIYDIRNWKTPVRSFVDSHHDDVTDIRFHPSDSKVLLSGSTDGYTNVYDLTQQDEEDALHQVINYASIHSCGWLAPRRIYTLSHMETLAIHELNDKSDDSREPQPNDFGDVRDKWGCDYVVDIYPGYIAVGGSQQDAGFLKIVPFENEMCALDRALTITSAHGDEIVRDVLIPSQNPDILYSCGEDGTVKTWKVSNSTYRPRSEFWNCSMKMDLFSSEQDHKEPPLTAETFEHVPSQSVGQQENKRTREKSKKPKKSHRYKPY